MHPLFQIFASSETSDEEQGMYLLVNPGNLLFNELEDLDVLFDISIKFLSIIISFEQSELYLIDHGVKHFPSQQISRD